MKIFETIEKGEFLDFGKPDRTIETMLSKLYFFGDKVVKRYKHKDAFYGNMADKSFRRGFHEADFFWNNFMAPEVYLRLAGIKEEAGAYAETDLDDADDFFIEMAKIDDSQNLTKLLVDKTATPELLKEIIALLVDKLRRLTHHHKHKLLHVSQKGWQQLFAENMIDLREWAYLADPDFPRAEADAIINLISARMKEEKYHADFENETLSVSIDNNCDNLLVINGKPSFIDIMPPKENWKVVDEYFIITRTAADAFVLGTDALGQAVYEQYEKFRPGIPLPITLIYEIRGALIQASYRHILNQNDLAEKYKKFILDRLERLSNI